MFSFHNPIYLVGAAVPEEELTAVEESDGEDSEGEDVSAGLWQGSKGIRQYGRKIDIYSISPILSHKITPSLDWNNRLERLNT